jgi:acyl carrier protein
LALPEPYGPEVWEIWTEVLGADIDPELGFLANGGDSFRAVQLVGRLFDVTGHEVDYLDVLEAGSVRAVVALLPDPPSGN